MRDTGHGLSSLIVKFLIFIFFFPSGLGTVHDILKQHIFFFLPLFCDFTCNQLGHPHYLSTSFHFLFWLLSKILFQNFQFFFPDISIFTLLGNYIWLLNFLVNPSRTAIDQYCHNSTIQNGSHFQKLAHFDKRSEVCGSVGWGCRIHRLHLCRGVRLPQRVPVYDTKQSDDEASLILELCGMQSTSLLPSLPDPLLAWSGST